MTDPERLSATLGLPVEPCGAGWRVLAVTGVPMYYADLRGVTGGGKRWRFTPILDLACVGEETRERVGAGG